MKLIDYLKKEKISVSRAAREMSINSNYLYMIISGKRFAGPEVSKLIVKYTHGKVTKEDLMKGKPKPESLICPHCGKRMSVSKAKKNNLV